MSIKVLLKECNTNEYPYIGIYKKEDLIVLFTEKEKGFVLHKGSSPYKIGDSHNSWREGIFDKLTRKVTLQND